MGYRIVGNNGHYEVYINGRFFCSADTETEAENEVRKQLFKLESDK